MLKDIIGEMNSEEVSNLLNMKKCLKDKMGQLNKDQGRMFMFMIFLNKLLHLMINSLLLERVNNNKNNPPPKKIDSSDGHTSHNMILLRQRLQDFLAEHFGKGPRQRYRAVRLLVRFQDVQDLSSFAPEYFRMCSFCCVCLGISDLLVSSRMCFFSSFGFV